MKNVGPTSSNASILCNICITDSGHSMIDHSLGPAEFVSVFVDMCIYMCACVFVCVLCVHVYLRCSHCHSWENRFFSGDNHIS